MENITFWHIGFDLYFFMIGYQNMDKEMGWLKRTLYWAPFAICTIAPEFNIPGLFILAGIGYVLYGAVLGIIEHERKIYKAKLAR